MSLSQLHVCMCVSFIEILKNNGMEQALAAITLSLQYLLRIGPIKRLHSEVSFKRLSLRESRKKEAAEPKALSACILY